MANQESSSLGSFAKLPPELRLDIWDRLFASIAIHGRATIRNQVSPPRNLAILHASRRLYEETSDYLYADLRHIILLSPIYAKQQWITAHIYSRGLSATCDFENTAEVRRHLQNFPHQRTALDIEISAPGRKDPGQIVLLWQKVNALVDILIALPSPFCYPHAQVRLEGRWVRRGEARETIKCPTGNRPDHEIVIMPFTRLNSSWDHRLPENLSAVVDKLSNPPYGSALSGMQRTYVKSAPANEWLQETAIFLDTNLDDIPGATADRLRLDRFSGWFDDGDSWISQYEDQFLSNFPINLEMALKHDYALLHATRRYRLLVLGHHLACHSMGDEPEYLRYDGTEVALYMNWNSQGWYHKFPHGFPAFDTQRMESAIRKSRRYFEAYESEIDQISQFTDALFWWGMNGKDVLGMDKSRFYTCGICNNHQAPCRWCLEYDRGQSCGGCKEFDTTGQWPPEKPPDTTGMMCPDCEFENETYGYCSWCDAYGQVDCQICLKDC